MNRLQQLHCSALILTWLSSETQEKCLSQKWIMLHSMWMPTLLTALGPNIIIFLPSEVRVTYIMVTGFISPSAGWAGKKSVFKCINIQFRNDLLLSDWPQPTFCFPTGLYCGVWLSGIQSSSHCHEAIVHSDRNPLHVLLVTSAAQLHGMK